MDRGEELLLFSGEYATSLDLRASLRLTIDDLIPTFQHGR
jgi:hypothetical protein